MVKPGAFAWFGATLVWASAAVMSFAGLDGLATSCLIAPTIAWLLPLVIDVGVAVAVWVWRRGVNPEASRLAGRMTWSLLVLTILGNGSHLGMEASHLTPPWWVAAVVGAIPPAVAGAVAHLLVLLARTADVPMSLINGHPASDRVTSPEPRGTTVPPAPMSPATATTPPSKPKRVAPTPDKTSAETKARALVAENPTIGRRALMVQTGLSDYQARKLLESERAESRNGVKVLEDVR